MDKDFYVSPFIDMEARYTVRVQDEPGSLRVAISERRRRAAADREPGAPARPADGPDAGPPAPEMPFVTHKTIGAIHLHALRLWRRGVTFHRHSEVAPMTSRSLPASVREPLTPASSRPTAQRVTLAAARRIRVGCLTVVLPDGSRRTFGDPASALSGEMRIHDPAALERLLLGGEVGGGEAYMDGLWSSPDLVALISLAVANRQALALSKGWWRVPAKVLRTVAHRRNRNTPSGARRNIAAHYDLGNDFYSLWLDETMTYSSAVFATPEQPLADAQRNKYRLMAERAGLEAGQHVLEIGTGWGGFALYAAGELGCRVTTVTVSRAQHELAGRRVREAGLEDRVQRPASRLP